MDGREPEPTSASRPLAARASQPKPEALTRQNDLGAPRRCAGRSQYHPHRSKRSYAPPWFRCIGATLVGCWLPLRLSACYNGPNGLRRCWWAGRGGLEPRTSSAMVPSYRNQNRWQPTLDLLYQANTSWIPISSTSRRDTGSVPRQRRWIGSSSTSVC